MLRKKRRTELPREMREESRVSERTKIVRVTKEDWKG